MKLTARWLATIGLTALGLVAVGSLAKASQQMWNPEVVHAARVTVSLLKSNSIRPGFLPRGSHLSARPIASLSLPLSPTRFASYTLKPSFSISSIEVSARRQTYQIKKLEFQLAQEQFKAGKLSQSELDAKAAEYQQAAEEFKVFLNSYRMAD